MKEFFKNKRNIALIASGLAIVLAVTGVVIYQTRKPEAEEAGNAVEESDNTDGEALDNPADTNEENTNGEAESETNGKTDGEAVSDPTKKPDDTTTTTKKPNGTTTTTKKPENKPRPTEPKPTQPKPTNPSTPEYTLPGGTPVSKEEYDKWKSMITEDLYSEFGGKAGYEAQVESLKNYKCSRCGDHNCPSIIYHKDLLGNISHTTGGDFDKCPAVINHTANCPRCGKPYGTSNDASKYPDKYCPGWGHIEFG